MVYFILKIVNFTDQASIKTNVQYWACGEKKNSNCKCFAKTVFISTVSNESSDSMNEEIESDPRCDLENFREIFVSADHHLEPDHVLTINKRYI